MRVPATELARRRRQLGGRLKKLKLRAVLFTDPLDVRYFSGFHGEASSLLIAPRRRMIITDARFATEAAQAAPGCEVVLWRQAPAVYLSDLLRKLALRRLGVCEAHLTVAWQKHLTKRRVELVDAGALSAACRSVKSAWELRQLRRAVRCAAAAFHDTVRLADERITELELQGELELRLRRHGAEAMAFATIVAGGSQGALPHGQARRRRLRPGVPVVIDFGARLAGYNSDLTRTLFIGMIPTLWRQRYCLVKEAQAAALAALRPGVAAAAVDAAAREVFAAHGLADKFVHSLGHGLGLAVHEAPYLSQRSTEKLLAGQVVTVEPGLYFPRRGGIRLEDDVFLTPGGCQRLSKLSRDLSAAVIA